MWFVHALREVDFEHNVATAQVNGAVVIRVILEESVFPLVARWPGMGDSGETLLVRAEQDSSGDATLFLNPFRFQPDAAMRLLIPASDERAGPAHLAARGSRLAARTALSSPSTIAASRYWPRTDTFPRSGGASSPNRISPRPFSQYGASRPYGRW